MSVFQSRVSHVERFYPGVPCKLAGDPFCIGTGLFNSEKVMLALARCGEAEFLIDLEIIG
jgi:hypothetical protein